MKEVLVRSRSGARDFTSEVPWAAIQICDLRGQWPVLDAINRVDLLQLRFRDQTAPSARCQAEELFSEAHAEQILDFVLANAGRIDWLLVHCEVGASRSPAVAAAVTRIFLAGDYYRFFTRHSPNILVYGRLLAAAQKRGLYQPPPDE